MDMFNKHFAKSATPTINSSKEIDYDSFEKKNLQDKFDEIQDLGEGGFGKVILAKNKMDNRKYAIKMICTTRQDEENTIMNEVYHLSDLEHENVVKYHGSWKEDKKPNLVALLKKSKINDEEKEVSNSNLDLPEEEYMPKLMCIQMEYCNRGTLRELMDSNDWKKDIKLIWWIFGEIAKGLKYIHSQSIIHGDIKPDNIFLTGSDIKVKIGDFGLSTLLKDLKDLPAKYSSFLSTYFERNNYIAPELFGENKYDYKCDVYSLGIIFFEMLYHILTYEERITIFPNGCRSGERHSINFPYYFGFDEQEMITSLLQCSPSNRPSSEEVFNSLPLSENDIENQKRVIKALFKLPSSRFSRFLVDNFFDKEKSIDVFSKAFNYDNMMLFHHKYSVKMSNELRSIFLRHGLHERIPDFLTSYINNSETKLQIPVMDRYGRVFALSSSLHQTFALFSAEKSSFNSFAFGNTVVCENKVEYPRQMRECAVDLMAPVKHASFIETELCCLISDLMKYLSITRTYTMYIGHAQLLEAIIEMCCYEDERMHIKEHLSSYCFGGFPNIADPEEFVSNIKLQNKNLKNFQKELFSLKPTEETKSLIINALAEMKQFAQNILNNYDKGNVEIIFATDLCYNPEVFSDGICFTLKATISDSCSNTPILAGGRFDKILALYGNKNDATSLCAAYGIDIFYGCFYCMFDVGCFFMPHVLIYPGMYLKEAQGLKKKFREYNYPASINYDENVSIERLKESCETQCIPYLLTITNIDKTFVYADTRFAQKLKRNDGNYCKAQMNYVEAVDFIISPKD